MISATDCIWQALERVGRRRFLAESWIARPVDLARGPRRIIAGSASRWVAMVLLAGVCALSISPKPAAAWNGIGHEVVARMTWNQLDEQTRAEAVRLLLATDPSAELTLMRPLRGGRRDQVLFERAATWPDYVRSEVPDENRPQWHYTNYFWEQDERGRPVNLPDMKPAKENVLTELPRLIGIVADTERSDHERGVALAWVLHLVGDLHQPLHCSARVTSEDPRGDRGGNSFKLEPAVEGLEDFRRDNLHSLWDGAVSRRHPQSFFESGYRYRQRLVSEIERGYESAEARPSPVDTAFDSGASLGVLTEWAKEGFELAKRACYPTELVRNQPAPNKVLSLVAQESKTRMYLAGHRLASVLEAIL